MLCPCTGYDTHPHHRFADSYGLHALLHTVSISSLAGISSAAYDGTVSGRALGKRNGLRDRFLPYKNSVFSDRFSSSCAWPVLYRVLLLK